MVPEVQRSLLLTASLRLPSLDPIFPIRPRSSDTTKSSGIEPIVPPGSDYIFESMGRRSTTPNSCRPAISVKSSVAGQGPKTSKSDRRSRHHSMSDQGPLLEVAQRDFGAFKKGNCRIFRPRFLTSVVGEPKPPALTVSISIKPVLDP